MERLGPGIEASSDGDCGAADDADRPDLAEYFRVMVNCFLISDQYLSPQLINRRPATSIGSAMGC
ncbi:hypothetical protein AB0C86_35175 [Streptomyces lavendulae]|uniref:hypothetical protein n=1 Tax=Streptomyces lavendulae TaxID=1914 RepID=UPI0033DC892B